MKIRGYKIIFILNGGVHTSYIVAKNMDEAIIIFELNCTKFNKETCAIEPFELLSYNSYTFEKGE